MIQGPFDERVEKQSINLRRALVPLWILVLLCFLARTTIAKPPSRQSDFISRGNTTYYVDAKTGSDRYAGTSPDHAWKTLERANQEQLAPGDKLLFRAGTAYHGMFAPQGSGKADQPILISKYGPGPTPLIAGDGIHHQAVLIQNMQYVTLENLEITNKGAERIPGLCGLHINLKQFGTAHDIVIRGLFIHDVYGTNVKSAGAGYGIFFTCRHGTPRSRFDGLIIEHNHLLRTDRNGICGNSAYLGRGDWYPSLHVIIRDNLLEDIGGDGIVPVGTDGCIVEHNRINGGRTRALDYAAGIWPWSADNTLIQYNEVSGYKGTKDAQGFDADWNCRNTTIQYNYSHNNQGGFLLVCNDGSSGKSWNAGEVHAVIRYNISINDGCDSPDARSIHIAGPVEDTQIYNNTIYLGSKLNQPLVQVTDWHGWPISVQFANNIFYTATGGRYDLAGHASAVQFSNNCYFRNQSDLPDDPHALKVDPEFINPGFDGSGRSKLIGYRLRADSPAAKAGKIISKNGGKDFFGGPVFSAKSPGLGAIESSGAEHSSIRLDSKSAAITR